MSDTYTGLRRQVLEIVPAEVGITPTPDLPRVWGLLMDTTYEQGGYSLVALADGTTSLYTTTGGGLIGGGQHAQVVAATLAALRTVETHLDQLPPSVEDALPPVDGVVLRALTYDGQRAVLAAEQDLGEGRHPQAEIFHAAHGAIAELRLINEAQQR
ncbi:hypothetical protein [Actinoplanes sp. NPDC049681]|uniref:hypothetical protein n=1 Tax=Actinoplanes sp. NPDC049681 TaxID=3363905 RepID=UPI0037B06ACE